MLPVLTKDVVRSIETTGEDIMQRTPRFCLIAALSLLATDMALAQAPAQPPSWSVPPESARCPSKWGAGDERGSGNLMKPQLVLEAVKLIKSGEIIDLSYPLGGNMPFFGTRRFD